jgi:hypothetical protein
MTWPVLPHCEGPQVQVGDCGGCGEPVLIVHVHTDSDLRRAMGQLGLRGRRRLEREWRLVDKQRKHLASLTPTLPLSKSLEGRAHVQAKDAPFTRKALHRLFKGPKQ